MATSQEVKETYKSTLQDLTCNSKPLISVLTMLAEENVANAKDIAEAIEEHLAKVRTDVKLPVLYLIDCIVKNVSGPYTAAFSANLAAIFTSVFQVVDEKTRMEMFKLRQTWNDVFSKSKLYALDVKTNQLDPAWPVTAAPPNIHFNPKFLNSANAKMTAAKEVTQKSQPQIVAQPAVVPESTFEMQQQLLIKQKQLLELQQKKLELELLQTQVKLQEQMKKSSNTVAPKVDEAAAATAAAAAVVVVKNPPPSSAQLLLKPEVAKQLMSDKKNESTKAMLAQINQKFPISTPPLPPTVAVAKIALRPPIRDPRLLRQAQQSAAVIADANLPPAVAIPITPPAKVPVGVVGKKAFVRDLRFAGGGGGGGKESPKKAALSRIPLKSKRASSPMGGGGGGKGGGGKASSRHSKSSSGSTSSVESPKKSSRSLSKSPSKSSSSGKYGKGGGKARGPDKRAKRGGGDRRSPKKDKSSRNYRRERPISISPDPDEKKDIDLRIGGPPEKQARIIDAKNDKDIDLRNSGSIGSKRLSSEVNDGPISKKNRAEIFDALFGSEDVDLRKLPNTDVERPITPPAPIISNKSVSHTEQENTNGSQETDLPPKLSLEVLRVKLANATNANKDYLQKSRLQAQAEQFKQRQSSKKDDKLVGGLTAEEGAKSGKLNKAQESNLIGKVIAQIEHKKVQEAKRKENEVNLSNMMTQPISDDEFDSDVESSSTAVVVSRRSDEATASSTKHSRFESRFNHEPQWKGKRARAHSRGRANPWIRPPLQHGAAGGGGGGGVGVGLGSGVGLGVVGGGPLWAGAQPRFEEDVGDQLPLPTLGGAPSPPLSLSGAAGGGGGLQDDICMSHENIKSINIDGEPRDILFYGETAIAFMSPDDPREISFQAGQRRVSFDDMQSYVLAFNDPYREVVVHKHCHRVRLGAPTREVYIDGVAHEVFFGGPPICVELDGKLVMVKIDGPAPQVKIGAVKRTDLVVGKVNLIVDAKTVVPIYLDARTQTFGVDGAVNTLRFRDRLRTVLINEVPHSVEFGGLPKGVLVNGRKHFIRFSVLPKGVRPGAVHVRDMEVVGSGGLSEGESSQDACDLVANQQPRTRKSRFSDHSPDRSPQNPMLNLIPQPAFSNFDNLLSLASSSALPTLAQHNMGTYQIEQQQHSPSAIIAPPAIIEPRISQLPQNMAGSPMPPITSQAPSASAPLNINDLFQKLVATGIVSTLHNQSVPSSAPMHNEHVPQLSPQSAAYEPDVPPQVHKHEVQMKPITFDEPSSLKVRQAAIVHLLYSGMQCSSCGMRFPQENSSQYSQHLDWHFRQNRKGKTNIRKASSRRWYYSISDWNNYEEFEDLEEREKCYFDSQQKDQCEGKDDENDGEIDIPSVPADINNQDPRCEVCQEKLEQFYNEEKEEWHLKMAIRVDSRTYHPLCYADYQMSLANVATEEALEHSVSNVSLDTETTTKEEPIGIPGLDVPLDDATVVVDCETLSKPSTPKSELNADEASRDAVDSDAKSEAEAKTNGEGNAADAMDAEDDDVVINEVEPERIVLDDYEFDENGLIAGVVVKQEPIDDGFTDIENFHLSSPKVQSTEPALQDESFVDIGVISEPAVPTHATTPRETEDAEEAAMQDRLSPTAAAAAATVGSDKAETPPDATAATVAATVEHTALAAGNEPPKIDGNLDCNNAGVLPPTVPAAGGMGGRIKINISKPLPVIAPKENKDTTADVDNNIEPIDPTQPLPPGEEPVQTHMKPALQGIDLKQLPPVHKGSELTGLCSIM